MKYDIMYSINKYKECEKHVLEMKDILENKYILDIGSNIGLFSLAICNNYKYKKITLFEPCKKYYEKSKIILKKYNNIEFNNNGIGNSNNKLILYKHPTHIGFNTFLKKDPNQKDSYFDEIALKEECQIMKIDDLSFDNIDFIKIDVEGFEFEVLEGGLNTIKKFKPYLFIEVGWGKNHPKWEKCEKMYEKLFKIGYKRVNFTNKTQDILFIPL